MKYIEEFRDINTTKKIIEIINKEIKSSINIMEVCGTHTRAIYKNRLDKLLPKNINLISGPGCPVCVTDLNYIDSAIELCKNKNVIICTFGDMLRVPGSKSSLNNEKAKGASIKVIYSPLDCLDIANKNKEKEVVFLGIGFETTSPLIGLTIKKAYEYNINNFSVFTSIKTMPNAIEKLVLDKEIYIDGFICPGHVGSIIGINEFDKLAVKYKIPMVMSGFEHGDISASILQLCRLIEMKDYKCENLYKRAVKYEGNKIAKNIIDEVFYTNDSYWRGIGNIKDTGLNIKEKYKNFDAQVKFNLHLPKTEIDSKCICGKILKGIKNPDDCELFKINCTPQNPMGPCMVSNEGTCANFYKYK